MTEEFAESALEGDDQAYTVRPYAVTGGRVSGDADALPVEALVESKVELSTLKGLTPEKKKILQLSTEDYVSVAELSAHCKLPLGVVRILVMDMAETEYLIIHSTAPISKDAEDDRGGITLSLLESVLDGIAAL